MLQIEDSIYSERDYYCEETDAALAILIFLRGGIKILECRRTIDDSVYHILTQ